MMNNFALFLITGLILKGIFKLIEALILKDFLKIISLPLNVGQKAFRQEKNTEIRIEAISNSLKPLGKRSKRSVSIPENPMEINLNKLSHKFEKQNQTLVIS